MLGLGQRCGADGVEGTEQFSVICSIGCVTDSPCGPNVHLNSRPMRFKTDELRAVSIDLLCPYQCPSSRRYWCHV